ncbi:unnamed protein product [Strongylus vulgaris]|uniref:Uncharacterized protein n=1 Tax=Strongylus vulgaris TaxID=40348 RepID=A0A3P7IZ00_STRVU|nr:unnamed protein product [Strongylus vulgaris]
MSKIDAKDNEIMEQNLHYEEMLSKEAQLKQDLEDVSGFEGFKINAEYSPLVFQAQSLNIILSEDNKTLQEQLSQLRSDIDKLQEQRETATHHEEELQTQLDECRQQTVAHEQNVQKLKSTVRVLEEKIESDTEEIRLVREQLNHHQNLSKERSNECKELARQLEEVRR